MRSASASGTRHESSRPTGRDLGARDARTAPVAGRLLDGLVALGFAGVTLMMRAAVRVYFRHLRVRHRERFPRRGPVLLVANHPAMWTDVLVLDVALARKLHFLALGQLFKPFVRAFLLELHGALPVIPSPGEHDRTGNEDTFRRCRALFDGGHVVALFPEGVSEADRTVLQLRTGAARLALAAARRDPAQTSSPHRAGEPHSSGFAGSDATAHVPVLVPTGIHYADRTSFGSEVTVSVGEPVDLAPYLAQAEVDPEGVVHALTGHLHQRLRSLILDLPQPALAAAISQLEPLARLSPRRGARELESAQRVAARLEQLRVQEPERFAVIRRHGRAYAKARGALHLSDRALSWDRRGRPWRQRTGTLTVLCVLGAPAAAVGALLHAAPWAAGEWIAHHVGRDPARFAFGRIISGLVFFPLAYLVLVIVLTRIYGFPLWSALAAVVLTVSLGLWMLPYVQWVHALWERARLLGLEWRQPRLVRRARAEQRLLLRLVAEAAAEARP